MAFTKVKLSGSTDGRQIQITDTATPGTLIHTADATALDEIWLWATNTGASPYKLTIEYGGTTSPNDLIEQFIQPEAGLMLIVPGSSPLTNSVVVRAFVEAAGDNLVMIQGYVNRIS